MKKIPLVLGVAAVAAALAAVTFLAGQKVYGNHTVARSRAAEVRLASEFAPRAAFGPAASAPRRSAMTSKAYAGYVVRKAGRSFSFVRASFFVPFVNCAVSPNASSSAWAGFDYVFNRAREAAGVEADCSGGVPAYFSWYQVSANANGPVQRNFKVRAGDFVTVSVTFSADHRFVVAISDSTLGKSATKYGSCPASVCRRSSAEVVSEATPAAGGPQPLADYGAESFSGLSVTDGRGQNSGFYAPWWNTTEISQIGMTSAKVIGQPTGLHKGIAFDNYWLGTR